jgi:hypothetical protein
MKSAEAHQDSPGKYRKANKYGSDFFYLPKSKFESFRFLSELFRKFNIFLEYAVPFLLAGLDTEKSLQVPNNSYVWTRDISFKNYDNVGDFVHPIKLSNVFKVSSYRNQYCNRYVQEKLNEDNNDF